MTKKSFLDAAIVLGLVLLGAIAYRFAPLLKPKTDIALPLSSCDLGRQACVATLPDGSQLEFSIDPRPIQALKALELQAIFRGSEVRKVAVDFAGANMEMGHNRLQLTRRTGSEALFTAQTNLAVCITGKMTWDATVLIDTGKAVVAVPFRFVSGN